MINISDEAKKAFLTDGVKKEVFIEFPNNDHDTITNSSIIKESLSFTESICSRDEFKFGLAEASTLEFECMNIDNIKGKTIRCHLRADGKHDILLGTFIVDSCDREADMMKRKVVAYGQKQSQVYINTGLDNFTLSKQYLSNKYPGLIKALLNVIYYSKIYFGVIDSEFEAVTSDKIDEWIYGSTLEFDVYKDNTHSTSEYKAELTVYGMHVDITDTLDTLYFSNTNYEEQTRIGSTFLANARTLLKNIAGYSTSGNPTNYHYIINKNTYGITEGEDYILNLISSVRPRIVYDIRDIEDYYKDGNENLPITYVHENVYADPTPCYFYPNIEILKKSTFKAYLEVPTKIRFAIVYRAQGTTSRYPTQYGPNPQENPMEFTYSNVDIKRDKQIGIGGSVYFKDGVTLESSELLDAYCELIGSFGHFTRNNSFEFFKLGGIFGRYPSETLYPREDIYPQDPNGGVIFKSNYISALYDDEFSGKYDRISVTYENEDGDSIYAYLQFVDDINNKPSTLPEDNIVEYVSNYNSDDYRTYSLGYNYLIQNAIFTADEIYKYLRQIAIELKKIYYMPADIEAQGMPWLEAGDAIGIETKDGGIVTYILRRTLSGIWFLKDNFESR